MKVFVDTNIFLDLILKREASHDAMLIFNAIEQEMFDGVILDITLLNIDYIAKKQVTDIREFLRLVNSVFEIVGISNEMVTDALALSNNDLEDNLQYIGAKSSHCEVIITNDKSFITSEIKTLSSTEFIKEYL